MRIRIEIPPSLLSPLALSNPSESAPVLAKLDGRTVLIELQGAIETDGDTDGQLIGKLGLEAGRPTLTISHHLLHGTFVNLPKPLAVLRKAPIIIDDEELEGIDEKNSMPPSSSEFNVMSSPMPSAPRPPIDYSSDLEPASSPYRPSVTPSSKPALASDILKRKRQQVIDGAFKKQKNELEEKRATRYECVGVIKTKVVFGKRPQFIVHLDVDADETS
ncbi:Chromosome transmission fidelity protein 8 [Phaffia rhodozyma]|uniref:Chromosome transmission fidelity protein 8 n=1 Tax=Phaffia rhodozyma TaxID=264483 RepID=A0A0F7SUC4_PHARH|nr:Chromosome transmission fidelity protein 8 [Phaffia rhodozyma]